MYILDTNVIIEMLRSNHKVIDKIMEVGIDRCCISEMTIAELYYGAVKGNRQKNFDDIHVVERTFRIIPVYPSFEEYARTRLSLNQKGTPLDVMDLLIGCTALHKGYVMVTHNKKHMGLIPELRIEDWQ